MTRAYVCMKLSGNPPPPGIRPSKKMVYCLINTLDPSFYHTNSDASDQTMRFSGWSESFLCTEPADR